MELPLGFLITIASVTFACAVLLTTFVRKLAFAVGAVDEPGARRKIHTRTIPRLGGIVVAGALVLGLAALSLLYADYFRPLFMREENRLTLLTLGLGGVIILVIGVVDDIRGLAARYKLVGEIAAGCIVWWLGISITKITVLGGGALDLPWWVSLPVR